MKASLQTVVDTFTAPTQAFRRVREHEASAWVPLLLIALCTLAVTTWYFTTVDVQQFMAEQIELSGQTLSPEELRAATDQTAGFLKFSGVISTLVMLIIYAVTALYLHMVASVATEAELKYGRWFTLVSYANLPTLVAVITIAVSYALAGGDYVSFARLDLTSLNNLVFHLPLNHPWTGVVNVLSLANLWAAVLTIIGYRTLTGGGWGGAIATVLIPLALITGAMATFAVL